MSYELKPCPFCGDECDVWHFDDKWTAGCQNPACFCNRVSERTRDRAVAAWNTRAERTCHNVSSAGFGFKCSECGCWEDRDYYRYCPDCGARVVSDEEQGHMVADAIRRLEKAVEA